MNNNSEDNSEDMSRKGIAVDVEIHRALNAYRLGGESWNDFFKRHLKLNRFTRNEPLDDPGEPRLMGEE